MEFIWILTFGGLWVLSNSEQHGDTEMAKCWAPKVYLNSNEFFFPSSVDFFLPHVDMYDGNGKLQETNLSSSNLKTGGSNWYLSTKTRLKKYNARLSFFRGQDPRTNSVPVYCLIRKKDNITDFVYWFFYPYNKGKQVCIGVSTFWGCAGRYKGFGHHIGDWEHVTVRLENNQPKNMYFAIHNFGYKYDWNGRTFARGSDEVQISNDGHPVVFSAEGSHGSWTTNAKHIFTNIPVVGSLVDYTNYGIEWRTWENLKVVPFKRDGKYTGPNKWLNFKGHWGNRERECGGLLKVFKMAAGVCGLNGGPRAPNWKRVMQKYKLSKKR